MKDTLAGKKVWITGASSGIGEHLAYECSRRGAELILSARRRDQLERVRSACYSPAAVDIEPFDLSDENAIIEAAQRVLQRHHRIDVLINNGGISQRSLVTETPLSVDRHLFDVNYFSHVAMTKAVLPTMLANRSGTIVVISSLSGKWGFYLRSAYAAAKHALHGFFESLRLETEEQGIRVSIVTPGFIATNISVNAVNKEGKATGEMDDNQAKGMPADACARDIVEGVLAGKKEFGVGGRELLALRIHRYLPGLFERIIRRQSAR